MRKIFETEKSPEDSYKYIQKLKNLEDTSINAPSREKTIIENYKYETRNLKYASIFLKGKSFINKITNKFTIKKNN